MMNLPPPAKLENDFGAVQLLEFDKILEQIAGVALCPISVEQIRALQPSNEADYIQRRLDELTEMRAVLDFDENFPLSFLPDLRPALQHLRIANRSLEIHQLIEMAQFLACARRVRGYLVARREKYPLLAEIAQPHDFGQQLVVSRLGRDVFHVANINIKN
jgi:DNA mismatch repair protein MutS2